MYLIKSNQVLAFPAYKGVIIYTTSAGSFMRANRITNASNEMKIRLLVALEFQNSVEKYALRTGEVDWVLILGFSRVLGSAICFIGDSDRCSTSRLRIAPVILALNYPLLPTSLSRCRRRLHQFDLRVKIVHEICLSFPY